MTAFAAPGDLNAPGLSPAPANDTGLTALEAGLALSGVGINGIKLVCHRRNIKSNWASAPTVCLDVRA